MCESSWRDCIDIKTRQVFFVRGNGVLSAKVMRSGRFFVAIVSGSSARYCESFGRVLDAFSWCDALLAR